MKTITGKCPGQDMSKRSVFEKIDSMQEKINSLRPFSPEMCEQLHQFYRIGLTYSSNAVEGNTLTLSETKVLLEDGLTVAGKPLKDHLEAIGHSRAFDLMWNLAALKKRMVFTETDIKTLHENLFYSQDAAAGKYREIPIIITGSSFIFPGPGAVPGLMKDYIKKLKVIKKECHPIAYAAKVHTLLLRIHPFADGNGRIARLLMNMVLWGTGYPVTVIPPIRRVEYIDTLERSHLTGDDQPFIEFIISCVYESQKELLRFFHMPV